MMHVTDIYHLLKPLMTDKNKWEQPIERYFHHGYDPMDPRDIGASIHAFATEYGFAIYDMTPQLHKTRTMKDLVKLYSTCVKLAQAQPKTLFFMVPNLEIPNSLSVVEGFFALRASLLAGSLNVFLQNKRDATKKEKKCMRGRCYNLVLLQSDNIITLSNNTILEIRRQLENLVADCPICLEKLSDEKYGAVYYPFECGHAFHDLCVSQCKECPTCRETKMMKGIVTFEMKRVK